MGWPGAGTWKAESSRRSLTVGAAAAAAGLSPKAPGAVAVEADGRTGGSQCAPLDGAGLYDLGLITPCSRAH